MQNDTNNIVLRKCKLAVDENPERLFLTKVGNLMPCCIPILRYIIIGQMLLSTLIRAVIPACFLPSIEGVPALWILNQVETIINARKQVNYNEKNHNVDLLQLMLNAAASKNTKVGFREYIISHFTYLFVVYIGTCK